MNNHQPWKRTRVKCIETGQTFESAREAAFSINVKDSAMSNHLAGRCGSLKGYKFERIEEHD